MPVAEEYQVVHDHLLHWSAWCSQSKVDLSSSAFLSASGLVLVDPLKLAEPTLEELVESHGPPVLLLLTNGNHERDSHWYARRFGCPALCHPEAVPEFAHPVSGTLLEGGEPISGCRVLELPGAAPGEIGLYLEASHALILGDILIHLGSTGLCLLPEKYAADPQQMRRSLHQLLDLPLRTIAFAHGLPIVRQAGERLAGLLGKR